MKLSCPVILDNKALGLLVNTNSDLYAEENTSTLIDQYGINSMSILDDSLLARSEYHILVSFFHIVTRIDPDIMYCWDIDKGSLNYIAKRSSMYGMNMSASLSRLSWPSTFIARHVLTKKDIVVNSFKTTYFDKIFEHVLVDTTDQRWRRKPYLPKGNPTGFGGKIAGRVSFNMWRLCRSEYKFTSFTIENVYAKVFGVTKPKISNKCLIEKFNNPRIQDKVFVLAYMFDRLMMESQIIDSMGLVQRTIEMAKVFTVNFESVLTRG